MSDKPNRLTPEQERGMKALLNLIETNYVLLQNGIFQGGVARQLAEVQAWLQQYHKDVKRQLPVPEVEKVAEVPAEGGPSAAQPADASVGA